MKDHSESRSGLDSSLRKGGAGGHNWGSLTDERQLETAGFEDENVELEEARREKDVVEDLSPKGMYAALQTFHKRLNIGLIGDTRHPL